MSQDNKKSITEPAKTPEEQTKVEIEELDDLDLKKVAGGAAGPDELQDFNGISCETTNKSMCACNQT
jgi:hypothetical protein